MTTRRNLLVALGAGALTSSLGAPAQRPAKLFKIGFLSSESASAWAPRIEAFRAGLRELGYVEGRNILIEFRWAEGNYSRLPELAADLVRLNLNVIVAGAAPASRVAKQATTTTPIVIVAVGDAVEFGLVASLARPGGNLTGSTFFSIELAAKRIELFKDLLPRVTRVGALLNPDTPGHESVLRAMESTARSKTMTLQSFEVRRPEDIEAAFSAMAKARVEVLVVPNQAMLNANAARIAQLAAERRLPSAGGAEFADVGCLLGYGPSFIDLYRRAANFVDKILKGAKPGDLSIERPTQFELVVNLKTAKALGLTLPQPFLMRADRVIE